MIGAAHGGLSAFPEAGLGPGPPQLSTGIPQVHWQAGGPSGWD